MNFLAVIGIWLAKKLGAVFGPIAFWLLEKIFWRVVDGVKKLVFDFLEKRKRAKAQKEAEAKLEQDVQSGAERTEEVRKNEEDYLNS